MKKETNTYPFIFNHKVMAATDDGENRYPQPNWATQEWDIRELLEDDS